MAQFAALEEIKYARAASGLSMHKAGPVVGYSKRAWENWEAGKRKMRSSLLKQFIQETKGEGK